MTVSDLMPYVLAVGLLVNVFAVITGMYKAISVLIAMHQSFTDLANKIGQKYPPEGLLGDMADVKQKQEEVTEKLAAVDTKMAVIESNVAQRRSSDKKGS